MDKGFSIMIACYNSSSLLKEVIENIERQLFGEVKIESIIVNNASTDNTYQVAQNYCEQFLSIPYVSIIASGHLIEKDKLIALQPWTIDKNGMSIEDDV